MKQFNTTAVCIPSKHYMVDLSGRVREIKQLELMILRWMLNISTGFRN